MSKKQQLQALKSRLVEVNKQIDLIVLNDGRVGLGDPLSREAHALKVQISKLQKPKLPAVRVH